MAVDKIDVIKKLLEAYTTGVRGGVITPCLQDENEFRSLLGLKEAPKEVEDDWNKSEGIRKPITLQRFTELAEEIPEAQPITEEANNEEI